MNTYAAKAAKAAVSLFLLLSASACVSGGSPEINAPTMLDYSYVPPSQVTAATPNYGLEDF